MKLLLSRVHFPVTTLGPGRRVGIWFQGCSIQCPGCISADTWAFKGTAVTVEELLARIAPWLDACDGITLSGGEPFDQPAPLQALLQALRARAGLDILVFSGHSFETLAPLLEPLQGTLDALVSDPFEVDQPQTLALRGSDNQRLHLLTPLGRERFAPYERLRTEADLKVDLVFDPDGTAWLAGIPLKGDMLKLNALLHHQGHLARVSEIPARKQVGSAESGREA